MKMRWAIGLLLGILTTFSQVHGQDDPEFMILLCNWRPGSILSFTNSGPYLEGKRIVSRPRPVAIDYDPVERQIYWTDVTMKHVARVGLDGKTVRIVRRLSRRAVPDGLALDVNAGKLFITDTGYDVIAVMDFSGSNYKTILRRTNGLTQPRAITLDPKNQRIFWTDWGTRPYIATATYDGKNMRKIVTTSIGWPNGLALDIKNNRLFWCDAKVDKIEYIGIDGTNRTTILSNPGSHYFDIVFHNRMLYFTDWRRRGIMKMSAGGGQVTNITSSLIIQAAGLHIVSNRTDECPPNTHGIYCEHSCGNCRVGQCHNETGLCSNGCAKGWRGRECKTKCPAETYGYCTPCGHCSGHFPCHNLTGYCSSGCQAGWKGRGCDRPCRSGTYGQGCVSCGQCSTGDVCEKTDGHCPNGCQYGWTGPLCKTQLQLTQSGTSSRYTGVIAGSIGGSLGIVLFIIIIVIIIGLVLFRRRSNPPVTRNVMTTVPTPVFSVPSSRPPTYSNAQGVPPYDGFRYTTENDRAILVSNEASAAGIDPPEETDLPEKRF